MLKSASNITGFLLYILIQIQISGSAQDVKLKSSEGFIPTKDSVRLYYRLLGEGKDTLIIIHGGPYNSGYLVPDLTPLAAHHTLLFYDQRAAGYSSGVTDTTKLTITNYVDDIETIRKHFRIKKLNLLGHSTGGLIAGYYAAEYPEKVKSAIIVNPLPASAKWMTEYSFMNKLDQASVAILRQNRDKFYISPADSIKACWDYYVMVARQYFPTYVHARRMWGDICNGLPANLLNPNRNYIFKSIGKWDITGKLSKLKAPVLIITGEEDAIPGGSFEQWKNSMANAVWLNIPGAGHCPYVDKPGAFFAATELFLRSKMPGAEVLQVRGAGVILDGDHTGTAYQQARASIIKIEDELVRLLNNGSWDSVSALYTTDATIFAPGAPPVTGKRGIAAFWHTAAIRGMKTIELQLMDIEITGNRMVATGKYLMNNSGNQIVDTGKFLAIYRREKGRWRLQTDMLNSSLETQSVIAAPDYLSLPKN